MEDVPEITPGDVMETTCSFIAFRVERDGEMRPIVFPAHIQILVVQGAHRLSKIDDVKYMAFSPLSRPTVYLLPESDFYECTRPVDEQ
jgi:hypothetical protein